ncbi:MAG: alkaline phosphatase PhoD [Synoicihabitans sp.]
MPPTHYPLLGTNQIRRRSFLTGSTSFAAAALLSSCTQATFTRRPKFSAYPFTLGVASGDPLADGVVLWTRLAPQPLEPGGGMGDQNIAVAWQIAEDEGMSRIVQSGEATAQADWSHTVHVEVDGLRADRWYWYQFKAGGEISPVGRTRTTPTIGSLPDRMRFAMASCQHYEAGLYTAYDHMAREDLDLVVHLGDYIYEGAAKPDRLRKHVGRECMEIDDYRIRYALYKSDPHLQAAHAAAPWIVTWDDHEVANNYANAYLKNGTPPDEFLRRRAAGYQAYFEHMPLRRRSLPRGPDMLLHRRVSYGRLAQFHVLDTRQYRTPQQLGDGNKPPTPVLLDPNGTLLGDRQRKWLFDGLDQSSADWNVLTQQVMMARVDRSPGPKVTHSMDQWPGYEFERRRVLKHFHDHRIKNPVVLTGDIHKHWANELIVDFDQLDSKIVGTEFVGTSISSSGNGAEQPNGHDQILAENPFVKLFNGERGYVSHELTAKTWRADYRTIPFVTRPDAPLTTRASFVVESGRPALNRV